MTRGLLLVACCWSAVHGADDTALTVLVSQVAEAQKRLPWFWSPALEGLPDTPLAYEFQISRTRAGGSVPRGGGLAGWRTIRMERVMLDFGSQLRCVSEDGKQPCSKEWNDELERQHQRRDQKTPEERLRIKSQQEERKQRRRAFWTEFPNAQVFQRIGPNEISFRPRPNAPAGLAGSIAGRLTFHPETHAITRLEYRVVRDMADAQSAFGKFVKGLEYSIELTRLPEGAWVPLRVRTSAKKNDVQLIEYSNYHRFGSASQIRFADSDDPPRP